MTQEELNAFKKDVLARVDNFHKKQSNYRKVTRKDTCNLEGRGLTESYIRDIRDKTISGFDMLTMIFPRLLLFLFSCCLNFIERRSNGRGRPEVSRVGNPEKKLRVAIFSDTFEHTNGISTILRNLLNAWPKCSGSISLIISSASSDKSQGVIAFKPFLTHHVEMYRFFDLNAPSFLEVLRHCKKEDYDLIHAVTPGPVGYMGLLISRLLGKPFIGSYYTHVPEYADILTEDRSLKSFLLRVVTFFYGKCDVILTPSAYTKGLLVSRYGLGMKRIEIVPTGVDTEAFNPSHKDDSHWKKYGVDREKILLYVGRVSKEKNLHLLAEAYERIRAQYRSCRLAIVGDGPYEEELKKVLWDGVIFTGCLKGRELSAAYASSYLLIFPSETDSFGCVVMEALASGIPAIVSNIGGPSEVVIHNYNGYIVRTDTLDSIVKAVLFLLNHPSERDRLSINARKSVEEKSWHKASEEVYTLYESAIGSQPPQSCQGRSKIDPLI